MLGESVLSPHWHSDQHQHVTRSQTQVSRLHARELELIKHELCVVEWFMAGAVSFNVLGRDLDFDWPIGWCCCCGPLLLIRCCCAVACSDLATWDWNGLVTTTVCPHLKNIWVATPRKNIWYMWQASWSTQHVCWHKLRSILQTNDNEIFLLTKTLLSPSLCQFQDN